MPRTGLNRHRRGYATKEAGSTVHFPVSGPIGPARSQFLNLPTSSALIITSCISAVLISYFITTGTIAHSRRSYTTYQGTSRNEEYQSYLMQLGIKQFL